MKSMKGLSMNRMLGSIKKKTNSTFGSDSAAAAAASSSATTPGETPEVTAHNSVKAFCESGGNAKTDEVLFLPPIVDAAESSPTAAAECARLIRKYLGKDYASRPSWQYNAIMLMRILADNPGPTFTRNLDAKFAETVKSLLKNVRDPSVRQLVMETLDDFERTKYYDENLTLLIQMWQKEKDKVLRENGGRMPALPQRPPHMSGHNSFNTYSQNYFSRHHNNLRLPEPVELTSRLEEARTSAKLLEQVVMNTPPEEMLSNELIAEFANRCMSASRSIQGYMVSTDPSPDNDTMESLIDTNEQLQTALNQHSRSVLNARKQLGLNERSENPSPAPQEQQTTTNGSNGAHDWLNSNTGTSSSSPSFHHVSGGNGNGKGKDTEIYGAPSVPPPGAGSSDPGRGRAPQLDPPSPLEDPFRDPLPGGSSFGDHQQLAEEPFRPGLATTYSGQPVSPTMHGAAPSTPAGGKSSHHPQPSGEVSDDDDIYASTPTSKEPMYRY